MATLKQKKVVAKILENNGNISKSMREVGYSPAFAKNPKLLTESDGYKEEAASFLYQMEKERDRLIRAMAGKDLEKVQYKDMTGAVDKLTKNIQLLSGGDTERNTTSINISFK